MKYALMMIFILGINGLFTSDVMIRSINSTTKVTGSSAILVSLPTPWDFSQYLPHTPIQIFDDTEFSTVNGVTEGSGTTNDPYIIEGWNITSMNQESGIHISNTSKFFTIRNCWIKSVGFGISIRNVSVGTAAIANNIVQKQVNSDFSISIYVEMSENSSINFNTCKSGYGIYLSNSGNSTVAYNNCSHTTTRGILLILSNFTSVVNNICGFNHGSDHGEGFGILLAGSHSSIIMNNYCYQNQHSAISLYSSSDCIVSWNVLQENRHGAYINNASMNNLLHHNTFENNTIPQAYDYGGNNRWYDSETSEGNYWSDYNGIDSSYLIAGSADARDLFPLAQPPIPETTEDSNWNIGFGMILLVAIILILLVSNKFRKK